jgi:hypothetical protein
MSGSRFHHVLRDVDSRNLQKATMKRSSSPDRFVSSKPGGHASAMRDVGRKKSRVYAPFRIVRPSEQYYKKHCFSQPRNMDKGKDHYGYTVHEIKF